MRIRTAFVILALGAAALAAACDDAAAPASDPGAGAMPTSEATAPSAAAPADTPAPTPEPTSAPLAVGAACSLGPAAAFPAGETTDAFMTSGGAGRTYHLCPGFLHGYRGPAARAEFSRSRE